MTKLKGINNHVCSWKHGFLKKKDTISPALISLCLSNQGRTSQLWSRATHNDGHKKIEAERMVFSKKKTQSVQQQYRSFLVTKVENLSCGAELHTMAT